MRWMAPFAVLLLEVACSCGGGGGSGADPAAEVGADAGIDVPGDDTWTDAGADLGGDASPDVGDASPDAGDPGWDLPFFLGVEYTEKGLAAVYAGAGTRWAKTRLEEFAWGAVEPVPPVGGVHAYDWTCTDRTVSEYQQAGVTGIQSYVEPRSPWGSVKYCDQDGARANCEAGSRCDTRPCPAFLADFEAWMSALVERYDGDGADDMAGLLEPVRLWVIAPEWTGFWPSQDADGYLELLAAAGRAARDADARARIGLIPFFLSDVFQGNVPTAQQVEERLRDPPPGLRNPTAGMMRILDHPELFDYVDLHSLGDYTELPPMLAWMRDQMARRGYSRPIVLDDAFPMGPLASWRPSPGTGLPTIYPVTDALYPAVYDMLVAVAKLEEPAYTPAMRWIRAQTAAGLVKKVVTAAGEGAAGIQVGNLEDWMHDTMGGARHVTVNFMGAAAMMGMVDVVHGAQASTCDPRTAATPRPAWYDLRLLNEKVVGFEGVERIAGRGVGVWAYRFRRGDGSVTVAWHEDGVLQLPGELEAAVDVDLPVPGTGTVRVTHAITDVGQQEPRVETVPVLDGNVALSLTSVPVFVEAGF